MFNNLNEFIEKKSIGVRTDGAGTCALAGTLLMGCAISEK
jgi:hypothetical protein